MKYEWSAVLDDMTCEDCSDLDGQEFEDEDLPDYPQHANCRCDLIPVIEDDTEQQLDEENVFKPSDFEE